MLKLAPLTGCGERRGVEVFAGPLGSGPRTAQRLRRCTYPGAVSGQGIIRSQGHVAYGVHFGRSRGPMAQPLFLGELRPTVVNTVRQTNLNSVFRRGHTFLIAPGDWLMQQLIITFWHLDPGPSVLF